MDRKVLSSVSILGFCICFAFGTKLRAAPSEARSAPAAAPAAAVPAAAARPAEPSRPVEASPSPSRSNAGPGSSGATNSNSGNSAADDHRIQPDHGHDGHRHPTNGGSYYPWFAYNYWDPNWNGYNNSYGPQYPGQFDQQDAAVAEPDSQSLSGQTSPGTTAPPSEAENASAALKAALYASPQWRDADAHVRVTQAEYDAASAAVLTQLRTQPAYQQAKAQKAADARQVASLKSKDPNAPMEQKEAVATAKLDAAQTVTQMETAALAADPRASAAKAKLDAAIAQRTEARRAIEAGLAPAAIPAAPAPAR